MKGTLTNIQKTPEAAIPSLNVLNALIRMCADPCNHVYIISGLILYIIIYYYLMILGRDCKFLVEHLGHIPMLGLRFFIDNTQFIHRLAPSMVVF